MKYKVQHLIVLLCLLVFISNLIHYDVSLPADMIELGIEFSMLITALVVMYYIEPLKTYPKVYWLMLMGSACYFVYAFIDISEEFFVKSAFDTHNLDDALKVFGFIFLCFGIHRWMLVYRSLIRTLKVQAETDQLTGLWNRRAFIQKITGKNKQSEGEGRALLLMDVDHFKSINDTYGHACGDIVLAAVAHELKSLIRDNDLLARWGGEEFLFHLLDVTEDKSIEIANALRQSIEQFSFECNSQIINCTVSIGVYHAFSSKCLETEVDCADQALYQAKNAGRNCVVLFKE